MAHLGGSTIVRIVLLSLLFGMAMHTPAAVMAEQQPAHALQDATPPAAELEGSDGDPDALSSTFLGEYDRLAAGNNRAEASVDDSATASDAGSLGGTLIFSLFMVGGLAYAGIWGYKQYTRQRTGMLAVSGKHLVLQETQTLGPNQKLHLVRLGEELLLLGATDHNITCLARYDADHLGRSFEEHLKSAQQTYPAPPDAAPVPLHESLNELRKVQRWQRGDDNA